MIRYVAIPHKGKPARADDDDWYSDTTRSIDVLVDRDEPVKTGLLDASGTPLYRVTVRGPCGFGR